MIISDLNYLEEINQHNAVVGGVSIDKTVEIEVDLSQKFEFNKPNDRRHRYRQSTRIDVTAIGNLASLTFDVTAIGNNSFAEGDVSVITTGNLSEVSGTLVSSVY